MKSEQDIFTAIDSIHMPDMDKEFVRQKIVQTYKDEEENAINSHTEANKNQNSAARKRHIPFPRYVLAAALALFFVGIPITTYAAIHFQWFSLFFGNATEQQSVLKELSEYMNTEETITETEEYKITVKGNLYSSDQQLGLIVCSIVIKEDNDDYFDVVNHKKERYLSKAGETTLPKIGSPLVSFLYLNKDTTTTLYYDGETSEDGGYLCGLRYNADSAPDKLTLIRSYGDTKRTILAEISIPKSADMPAATFSNKQLTDTTITLSPLGITFHNMGSGKQQLFYDNTSDGTSIRNTTKLVLPDKKIAIADISTSSLIEDISTFDSYQIYQEFDELVNIQDVAAIQVDSTTGNNAITFQPE